MLLAEGSTARSGARLAGRTNGTKTTRTARRARDHWRGTRHLGSCRAAARRGSARRGRHARVVRSQPINPLCLRESSLNNNLPRNTPCSLHDSRTRIRVLRRNDGNARGNKVLYIVTVYTPAQRYLNVHGCVTPGERSN